jgi:hypothetical protein
MTKAVYQVRLVIDPAQEEAFNAWYEGTYIPKLMSEVPHFTAVHRYEAVQADGTKLYVTDYDCTSETMPLAIAEMRVPGRAEDNAEFYRWKDRAITLHESLQLHGRFSLEPER